MDHCNARNLARLLAVVAALLATPAFAGVTSHWLGAVDDQFTEAGNWDAGVPAPGDAAVFALDAAYAVAGAAPTDPLQLLHVAAGQVAWQVGATRTDELRVARAGADPAALHVEQPLYATHVNVGGAGAAGELTFAANPVAWLYVGEPMGLPSPAGRVVNVGVGAGASGRLAPGFIRFADFDSGNPVASSTTMLNLGVEGGTGRLDLLPSNSFASFEGGGARIGVGAGSVGQAFVDGKRWWGKADLILGKDGGAADLVVQNGGELYTGSATFGDHTRTGLEYGVSFSDSAFRVTGWTDEHGQHRDHLRIGVNGGYSNVDFFGASTVTVAGDTTLGSGAGSYGNITLYGESTMTGRALTVGHQGGTAFFEVANFAVATFNQVIIGDHAGAFGQYFAEVAGQLTVQPGNDRDGTLTVAHNSTAGFTIDNGGSVTAHRLLVATGDQAHGTVRLDYYGYATVAQDTTLAQGPGTQADLVIVSTDHPSSGWSNESFETGSLTAGDQGQAHITVAGAGARLHVVGWSDGELGSDLTVLGLRGGNASAEVRQGGAFNAQAVVLGDGTGSFGSLLVTDSGSQFNSNTLELGRAGGSGYLDARNGAELDAGVLTVGPDGSIYLDDATIFTDQLQINPGGELRGGGNLGGGPVVNAGALELSTAQPVTLNVSDTYTQLDTGALFVTLDEGPSSRLHAGGAVALDGLLHLSIYLAPPPLGTSIILVSSDTGLSGVFAEVDATELESFGLSYALSYSALDVTLTIVPIPEPHAAALALLALALSLRRRARVRAAQSPAAAASPPPGTGTPAMMLVAVVRWNARPVASRLRTT